MGADRAIPAGAAGNRPTLDDGLSRGGERDHVASAGGLPTMQRYFYARRDAGAWQRINNHLVMAAREAEGG